MSQKKGRKKEIYGIFAQKLQGGFINIYKMLKKDCKIGCKRAIIKTLKTLPVTIPNALFVQSIFSH